MAPATPSRRPSTRGGIDPFLDETADDTSTRETARPSPVTIPAQHPETDHGQTSRTPSRPRSRVQIASTNETTRALGGIHLDVPNREADGTVQEPNRSILGRLWDKFPLLRNPFTRHEEPVTLGKRKICADSPDPGRARIRKVRKLGKASETTPNAGPARITTHPPVDSDDRTQQERIEELRADVERLQECIMNERIRNQDIVYDLRKRAELSAKLHDKALQDLDRERSDSKRRFQDARKKYETLEKRLSSAEQGARVLKTSCECRSAIESVRARNNQLQQQLQSKDNALKLERDLKHKELAKECIKHEMRQLEAERQLELRHQLQLTQAIEHVQMNHFSIVQDMRKSLENIESELSTLRKEKRALQMENTTYRVKIATMRPPQARTLYEYPTGPYGRRAPNSWHESDGNHSSDSSSDQSPRSKHPSSQASPFAERHSTPEASRPKHVRPIASDKTEHPVSDSKNTRPTASNETEHPDPVSKNIRPDASDETEYPAPSHANIISNSGYRSEQQAETRREEDSNNNMLSKVADKDDTARNTETIQPIAALESTNRPDVDISSRVRGPVVPTTHRITAQDMMKRLQDFLNPTPSSHSENPRGPTEDSQTLTSEEGRQSTSRVKSAKKKSSSKGDEANKGDKVRRATPSRSDDGSSEDVISKSNLGKTTRKPLAVAPGTKGHIPTSARSRTSPSPDNPVTRSIRRTKRRDTTPEASLQRAGLKEQEPPSQTVLGLTSDREDVAPTQASASHVASLSDAQLSESPKHIHPEPQPTAVQDVLAARLQTSSDIVSSPTRGLQSTPVDIIKEGGTVRASLKRTTRLKPYQATVEDGSAADRGSPGAESPHSQLITNPPDSNPVPPIAIDDPSDESTRKVGSRAAPQILKDSNTATSQEENAEAQPSSLGSEDTLTDMPGTESRLLEDPIGFGAELHDQETLASTRVTVQAQSKSPVEDDDINAKQASGRRQSPEDPKRTWSSSASESVDTRGSVLEPSSTLSSVPDARISSGRKEDAVISIPHGASPHPHFLNVTTDEQSGASSKLSSSDIKESVNQRVAWKGCQGSKISGHESVEEREPDTRQHVSPELPVVQTSGSLDLPEEGNAGTSSVIVMSRQTDKTPNPRGRPVAQDTQEPGTASRPCGPPITSD